MWLLNVNTRKLEHFVDEASKYGRYAILSHVWEDEEVSFQDIWNGIAEQRAGYRKIEYTCQRALRDKLDYCWIDTCCIDKTSSAELSEAINSMYRWYYQSKVCYAYLFDVPNLPFGESKWFTRGWTLQELIAPGYVEFFDEKWEPIGSKISLVKELAQVSRIDPKVLRDRTSLTSVSVASRMSWAANRSTSRTEDAAYSLMGIFDVNMPMLYGEGNKAFARLQEEIIRTSTDHSILVWQAWEPGHDTMLLAPSPFGFRHAHHIVSWTVPGLDESFILSNKGLRISLPMLGGQKDPNLLTAILNCRYANNAMNQISLFLRKQPHGMIVPTKNLTSTVCEMASYKKPDGALTSIRNVDRKFLPQAKWMDLMILKEPVKEENEAPANVWTQKITILNLVNQLGLLKVHPDEAWDHAEGMTFVMTGSSEHDRGYMVFGEKEGKKKFVLAFGYVMNSGRVEPRVWLARSSTLPGVEEVFKGLEGGKPSQSAKIEYKKGMSELVAMVERRMTMNGELEWTIHLKLEAYGSLFRDRLHHLVH